MRSVSWSMWIKSANNAEKPEPVCSAKRTEEDSALKDIVYFLPKVWKTSQTQSCLEKPSLLQYHVLISCNNSLTSYLSFTFDSLVGFEPLLAFPQSCWNLDFRILQSFEWVTTDHCFDFQCFIAGLRFYSRNRDPHWQQFECGLFDIKLFFYLQCFPKENITFRIFWEKGRGGGFIRSRPAMRKSDICLVLSLFPSMFSSHRSYLGRRNSFITSTHVIFVILKDKVVCEGFRSCQSTLTLVLPLPPGDFSSMLDSVRHVSVTYWGGVEWPCVRD